MYKVFYGVALFFIACIVIMLWYLSYIHYDIYTFLFVFFLSNIAIFGIGGMILQDRKERESNGIN